MGRPGALRGSGPAGALGPSGALPWALAGALLEPLKIRKNECSTSEDIDYLKHHFLGCEETNF